MDLNDVRSAVTLLSLALFLALMGWTWWPAHKADHEAAAQLPFDGEANGDAGAAREPERRAAPSRARSPGGIVRGTPRTRGEQ